MNVNRTETFTGYEELNLTIPISVKPYIEIVYGIQKEIDRLLEFKVGNVCQSNFNELIERVVFYSLKAGMQYQKELDNAVLVDMQRQLDVLIKRDGQAAKERKRKVNEKF